MHQEAAITQSSPFLNQFMRFFLQSIRVIVHIILSPYEPNFDQYLRRYKNILKIPLIPLTPTRKNPYPSPGVRVFAGRGRGTPPDTRGLPLTITSCIPDPYFVTCYRDYSAAILSSTCHPTSAVLQLCLYLSCCYIPDSDCIIK